MAWEGEGAGPDQQPVTIHASCVLVGEAGILIRGASGSGKSTLARQLLDRAEPAGLFGRLVSDDRVALSRRHGRIRARTMTGIEGRLEIRGLGIVAVPWEPAAIVRLVVDCGAAPPRLPAEQELQTELLGVTLPRIAVAPEGDSVGIVLWRLRDLRDTVVAEL